jgi:hypothetical protein
VAATLVFSSLLLANFALFASAGQRERLSATANSESLISDTGTILVGTEGVGLLSGLQEFLAAHTLDCSSANQEVGSFVGSLGESASESGLTVSESAAIGVDQSQHDNLSTLSPFNGSSPGGVSLTVRIHSSGESAVGDVAYDRAEIHYLNLPVRLDQMMSLCQGAVQEVASVLELPTFPTCNASAVAPILAALERSLERQASEEGLASSIAYRLVRSTACIVDFTVGVSQPGADGPEGPFTAALVAEGSAPVRVG